MLGEGRFNWGVNIDDLWIYAGLPPPKSELMPYVLSMRLARGPVEILTHPSMGDAIKEVLELPDQEEAVVETKELCDDLVLRLKEAGVGFVRCWFPWNFFMQKIGQDITFPLDTFVETLKAADIGILGVIGNGYSRFLPDGASTEHLQQYTDQLVSSSRAIVSHYKDAVGMWQIENEPNWWKEHLAVRWRAGLIWLEPEAQQLILKSLHDVVREECPDAKIIINLEADRQKADWRFYSRYCDVLGLDLYPGYAHPHHTSAEGMKLASEVKKDAGVGVLIAETGYPSGPRLFGYSEERQSEYIRSACETAYSCDEVEALCAWRLADSYWKSFPVQENHFGLLTREREPKAAWSEYASQVKARS